VNTRTVLLLAFGAILLAAGAMVLLRRDSGPATAVPAPAVDPGGARPGGPPPPAPDAVLFRSRDEVLLLARQRPDGRPLGRAPVALRDAAGSILERGETDSRGLWRGRCPAGAEAASVGAGDAPALVLPLPPAPESRGPVPPLLADRPALRPGDEFRVLAWIPAMRTSTPAGRLLADGEAFEMESSLPLPGTGWREFLGRVPADARPGPAVIEIGDCRLPVPLVPRFGPAAADPPGPAAADGPSPAEEALSPADGGWWVDLSPPADDHAVLVFAAVGDRFLEHGVSVVDGRRAFVALPAPEVAEPVEVVAVVAAAAGFRVHRKTRPAAGPSIRFEPLPGPPGPAPYGLRVSLGDLPVAMAAAACVQDRGSVALSVCDDAATHLDFVLEAFRGRDALVRAIAFPPGTAPVTGSVRLLAAEPIADGPAWIHEGDAPAGPGAGAPAEAAFVPIRVFLPAGIPTPFTPDPPIPPDAPISWEVVGSAPAGAMRLTAGPAVLLEARFDGPARAGTLPPGPVAGGALLAVSDEAGFDGLVLGIEVPVHPAAARAADAPGLSVERRLPAAAAAGSDFEAAVVVRSAGVRDGPFSVRMPLPRGVVPAEDGWAIRDRAPEGTRVDLDDARVEWRLPSLPAGETTLACRVRAAFRGRWGAPPAVAATLDPTGPLARSAGAVLVVE